MSEVLGTVASVFVALTMLAAILAASARRLDTRLASYVVQSLAVGAYAAVLAAASGRSYLYLGAAGSLALKCGLMPRFLAGIGRRHRRQTVPAGWLQSAPRLLLAGIVAALAYRAAAPLGLALLRLGHSPIPTGGALAVGLAAAAVALFGASRDREPTAQVLGVLALENGVALASLAATAGSPVALSLLLVFEAACAALLFIALEPLLAESPAGVPAAAAPAVSSGGER